MTPPDRLGPRAVPCDYDSDPGRFAANLSFRPRAGDGDMLPALAQRLAAGPAAGPVLELGGGTGPLARQLSGSGVRVVVADLATYLARAPRPAVCTDARCPGFRAGAFGTVAALWMLYHLADPMAALREADRILRPGGWLVACAPSRFNDPELAPVLPGWGQPLTFDAENAAGQVGGIFQVIGTERWDKPLIQLADPADVRRYLRGRGLPPGQIGAAAEWVTTPVRLTKRGVLIWARKPGAAGG